MDDIGNSPPDTESVIGSNLDFGEIRISRYEPTESVSLDETLQGIISIELTYGNLAFGWIAVTLIYYNNIARLNACIDHRISFHSDEIARFWIRA